MIFFNETYILAIFLSSLVFWGLVREKYRTAFIILLSFVALLTIQVKFTFFLVVLVMAVYLGARAIERSTDRKGRRLLAAILVLVIVLLVAKYAAVLFSLIFSAESAFSRKYIVPLGVSYLCFKLIAFVIDVYRGIIKDPGLDELLAFIFFIPSFPAGPIERYQNFAGRRQAEFDPSFYIAGLRRLALGYFKKVVVINYIFNETLIKGLRPEVMAEGVPLELPAGMVLVFLAGSLIYAYVDLSAYADIAIGFGRLFGYKICENMNYPVFQSNLGEFWRRWHISLSFWCRNNVYFPVLGATRNISLGLCASFIVMGLWHNISLNWFLWGMWHATGLIVYSKWTRFKRRKKKEFKKRFNRPMPAFPPKIAYGLGMLLTCLWAAFGYAFIMTDRSDGMIGSAARAFRLLLAIIL